MPFAAVSEKVKAGKAHGVEMCGEKLVLFRGKDGKVISLQCQYNGLAPLKRLRLFCAIVQFAH